MWFKELTGFDEISPEFVRENITIEEIKLHSKVNGKSDQFGFLEIPTLASLRLQAPDLSTLTSKIRVQQITGNVRELHCKPENKNALFQAASQFNLLEMVGPNITPERGIDIYENDHTQGPACAIACGAGTIYRNYFAPVNGQIGQSCNNQIDCLDLIGKELKNKELSLWNMSNGYALPSQGGLLNINKQLDSLNATEFENLRDKLKIGIQWNTEVTISDQNHVVSQAYCSALPISYSRIDSFHWEQFARLILEATYEATLYAGLINYERTGSEKVFLTLVGGGAFGNKFEWISASIRKALIKFRNAPLEIYIVSYGNTNPGIEEMLKEIELR